VKRIFLILVAISLLASPVFAGPGSRIKPTTGFTVPFDTSTGVTNLLSGYSGSLDDIDCVYVVTYNDDVLLSLNGTAPAKGTAGVGGNGFLLEENGSIILGPHEANQTYIMGGGSAAGHVQVYLYPVWVEP